MLDLRDQVVMISTFSFLFSGLLVLLMCLLEIERDEHGYFKICFYNPNS